MMNGEDGDDGVFAALADAEGSSGTHLVATMSSCVNPVAVSTLLGDKPSCGCY